MDYFLVGRPYLAMVSDSLIHNQYYGSDHCPIELKINMFLDGNEQDGPTQITDE